MNRLPHAAARHTPTNKIEKIGDGDGKPIPYDQREGFIWMNGALVPWRDAKVHI